MKKIALFTALLLMVFALSLSVSAEGAPTACPKCGSAPELRPISGEEHTIYCANCEEPLATVAHTFGPIIPSPDPEIQSSHVSLCECGYGNWQSHSSNWTSVSDNEHSYICSVCGLAEYTEEHNMYNSNSDSENHYYACSTCDYTVSEAHDYGDPIDLEPYDDLTHYAECVKCYYRNYVSHTFGPFVPSPDPEIQSSHVSLCECGYGNWQSHSGSWISVNDKEHSSICSVCGFAEYTFDHNLELLDKDSENHYYACSTCDYSKSEAHNYGDPVKFSPFDDLTHVAYCTVCQNAKYENHVYEGSAFCSACGIECGHYEDYLKTIDENMHGWYCPDCNTFSNEEAHELQVTLVEADGHFIGCAYDCGYVTEKQPHINNGNGFCEICNAVMPYCDICGWDMEYVHPIVADVNGVTMHIWGCEHGKWDMTCDMHELVRDLNGESVGKDGHRVACTVCWGLADVVAHTPNTNWSISSGASGHSTKCQYCMEILETVAHSGTVTCVEISDQGHSYICDGCFPYNGLSPIEPHDYDENGVCTACGNEDGPKLDPGCPGHTFEVVTTKPATCTENGSSKTYCGKCGIIHSYNTIPAYGCSFTLVFSNENGTHTLSCANGCGSVQTETCALANGVCAVCGYSAPVMEDKLPAAWQLQLPVEEAVITMIEDAQIASAVSEDGQDSEKIVVPENAVLVVDEYAFEAPVQVLPEIAVEAQRIINVAIKVDEEIVQPSGAVTITLTVTEEEALAYEGKILLFVGEDGLLYEVPYEIIDGQLVFTCEILGAFIVVDPVAAEGLYTAYIPEE